MSDTAQQPSSQDALAEPTNPTDPSELEARLRAHQEAADQRNVQLHHDARAVYRAMEGWARVQSEGDWVQTCQEAKAAYRSGRFLIERLGAERYLDPELMATLWGLRQELVQEGQGTTAEGILIDLTMIGFHHALRVQGWAGNLESLIEAEFFGAAGPSARFDDRYGRASGLVVEDRLERLGVQLLPLLDRANRLVLRNLKALQELRQRPTPAVAIGRAGQVNVASRQINVAGTPQEDQREPEPTRHP